MDYLTSIDDKPTVFSVEHGEDGTRLYIKGPGDLPRRGYLLPVGTDDMDALNVGFRNVLDGVAIKFPGTD